MAEIKYQLNYWENMAIVDEAHPNTNTQIVDRTSYNIMSQTEYGYGKMLVMTGLQFPAQYENSVWISTDMRTSGGGEAAGDILHIGILQRKTDVKKVTYNSMQFEKCKELDRTTTQEDLRGFRIIINSEKLEKDEWDNIKNNGIVIWATNGTKFTYNSQQGYVNVTQLYENYTAVLSNANPQTGYVSKAQQNTFHWEISDNARPGNPVNKPTVTRATFKWRVHGQSAEKTLTANANGITVPAGTFTGSQIDWTASVTLSNGNTSSLPQWYTLTTVDGTASCTALSPKELILDDNSPVTFVWQHSTPNGTHQTAYELQTNTDGTGWTTIKQETTHRQSATVPPGTLTGGDMYWRCRTSNADGVAGSWSNSLHNIVIAAPPKPKITILDASPQFAIRWEQQGQQSYEIRLDGQIIARQFGTGSNYQYTGYATPGNHKLEVRVQNSYGLWSEWGTVTINIVNDTGYTITLDVSNGDGAVLIWTDTGTHDQYIVYRNGIPIAKVQGVYYRDQYAAGATSYQVRGIYADRGAYTLSDTTTIEVKVPYTKIAAVVAPPNTPQWLDISKSVEALTTIQIDQARLIQYSHYAGQALPSVERGEFIERSYQFSAGWKTTDQDQIKAFEALMGKLVCLKTPSGVVAIGILGQLSRATNPLITTISATITEIDLEGTAYDSGL